MKKQGDQTDEKLDAQELFRQLAIDPDKVDDAFVNRIILEQQKSKIKEQKRALALVKGLAESRGVITSAIVNFARAKNIKPKVVLEKVGEFSSIINRPC